LKLGEQPRVGKTESDFVKNFSNRGGGELTTPRPKPYNGTAAREWSRDRSPLRRLSVVEATWPSVKELEAARGFS
jgi:hypothetical protein